MGWRLWPDICREYYSGMVYAYDLMVYYDDYHRDPVLRRFFVALEKSNLPNWAKENFLTMFSFNYITFTKIFFANKGIIKATDRAEEWEQEQKRGLIKIKDIIGVSAEKDITNGESLKYIGISMLPKMLDNHEYCFTIDGEEVKGTKAEFIERFKKALLSDKVQKDNELEEQGSVLTKKKENK